MAVYPPADGADGLDDRGRRAREMRAAVEHRGGPLYEVRSGDDEYRVDLADGTCECPDYTHREVRCKHLRRVAIEVTDGEVPPPSAPRVTEHREHPDQGGAVLPLRGLRA
jgi:SWIM zinc finger.